MDFQVFNTTKMDEYTKKAKEQWGQTAEYKEYEEKTSKQSLEAQKQALQNFMLIFVEFGKMMDKKPEKVIELAVKGMLPKGPLGRKMYKKLHVYAGPEHEQQAQKPEVYTF